MLMTHTEKSVILIQFRIYTGVGASQLLDFWRCMFKMWQLHGWSLFMRTSFTFPYSYFSRLHLPAHIQWHIYLPDCMNWNEMLRYCYDHLAGICLQILLMSHLSLISFFNLVQVTVWICLLMRGVEKQEIIMSSQYCHKLVLYLN